MHTRSSATEPQSSLQGGSPTCPRALPCRLPSPVREDLGCGRTRSRGHFWLPSRVDEIEVWDGAGGLLSIGSYGLWGSRPPSTHLTDVGIDAADRGLIADAFAVTRRLSL